jgi:hypothetical protein
MIDQGVPVRIAPGGGHFFYSRSLTEIIGSLLPAAGRAR